ncbi:MAG: type II toxin-antitoxin system ParD family antitoxin [Rubritepida sp.]|nr:type II toxin-antitoxin system ParD family antitoxin [Rubritepida sp.]
MTQLEHLGIDVHPDVANDLRAAVAAGEFANVSEAIQVAVESWQAHRALEGWDIEELRKLVQDGMDSGPGIPAEVVFARLRAKIAAL